MSMESIIRAAAAELLRAPHGAKSRIVAELAEQLGCSVATAHRQLSRVLAPLKPRQRRSDAGDMALTRAEAMHVASLIQETRKLTGTGELPIEEAVDILRANKKIEAIRVDTGTGEILPLSVSSICRALRAYGLHRDQLTAPTPATRLSSPHPNWCWQIDASVSRQFYLADDGTRIMDKAVFYRGKPKNFERISDRRLWRYVVTDHASGAIEVLYVQGAESAVNLITALIHAMTRRTQGTMHGVPRHLMMDPGSAVTASTTANFLAACNIAAIINEVGNARAKGQVENAHYLVERHFEATLKLRAPVTSLEEINTLAQVWAYHYNSTRTHTRTGLSRRDGWLRITREQLIEAPSIKVLSSLANSAPKPCTVRDCRIRFRGAVYDVSGVPGLINGQRLPVVVNALEPDGSVRVLMQDPESGHAVHYIARREGRDGWGFADGAARIGAEYKAAPETPADAARKELERLAMQVHTDAEAAAARKAKKLAFGGSVDPMKHMRDAIVPPSIPRAGTAGVVDAPVLAERHIEPKPIRHEFPALNHVEAAVALKPLVERAGQKWMAEMYARTAARWPDGLPRDQVEAWAAVLATPNVGLRLVTGGAE